MTAAPMHTPTTNTDARPQMCIRPPEKSQLTVSTILPEKGPYFNG
jgi:hypothetical protein